VAVVTEQVFKRNLEALGGFQLGLAELIGGLPIPPGARVAAGRDGSTTYLIETDGGRAEWLGESSMPSVSGPEILAGFASDGRNAVLPGILTGFEPLVALGKMPPCAALIVVEKEPTNLALALRLYDYAEYFAAGRLLLFLEDGLTESWCGFIEAHPGYEMPSQMLTVPQRTAAQLARLRGLIESAGEAAAGVQRRLTDASRERLIAGVSAPGTIGNTTHRTADPAPLLAKERSAEADTHDTDPPVSPLAKGGVGRPRVALVSSDPNTSTPRQAERICRGLAKLGWPCEVCVANAPCNRHPVARLQTVLRASPTLVLSVNCIDAVLQAALPPGMASAAWFMPGAAVGAVASSNVCADTSIFTSSVDVEEALIAAGVSRDVSVRCEVGADDVTFQPADREKKSPTESRGRLALLMDLPDDRVESCGVALASHQTLFNALKEAIAGRVNEGFDAAAEELLERAQRACGVAVEDDDVRRQFVTLARTRLIPVAVARATARALASHGGAQCPPHGGERQYGGRCPPYKLAIWGRNWARAAGDAQAPDLGVPQGEELSRVFGNADAVVLPYYEPWVVQTGLDAMAAGVIVLMRAADQPFQSLHPQLSDMIPHFNLYRTRAELVERVRQIMESGEGASERLEAARAAVLAGHCVSHRLVWLNERARARIAAVH